MAEVATLARPYASAAFDLAKAADRLPQWSRMLGVLAAATKTNEVQALIRVPSLDSEVKAHQLADLLRDQLDDRGRRFVQVLAANNRLELLPEIAVQFDERKAEAERVLEVEVVAAVELTPEQEEAYTQALQRRFDQQVQVVVTVDPKLVGGALVRAGDTVIDASVRGRLSRLVAALQRA